MTRTPTARTAASYTLRECAGMITSSFGNPVRFGIRTWRSGLPPATQAAVAADDRERAARVDQRAHADRLIDVLTDVKALRGRGRRRGLGRRRPLDPEERGQRQQGRSSKQLAAAPVTCQSTEHFDPPE